MSDSFRSVRRPHEHPFSSFAAATEVGVNLKEGYNGDLTSRQAGSVGGQMVKKMIEAYEQGLAAKG
ncbi:MAG: alpha/beta-type small acid-soluble spore protein [Butyricicoccus sp.]|nr:alpha/beta-type small acid-soluble spore protein [Butyricicoccus sp.]